MEFQLDATLAENLSKLLSNRTRALKDPDSPKRAVESAYLELIPPDVVATATQKQFFLLARKQKGSVVVPKYVPVPAPPLPKELDSQKAPAIIEANTKFALGMWLSPDPSKYIYGLSAFCKVTNQSCLPGNNSVVSNRKELVITDVLGWDIKEEITVKRTKYLRFIKFVTRAELENIDSLVKKHSSKEYNRNSQDNVFNSYYLTHNFFFLPKFKYSNIQAYRYIDALYSMSTKDTANKPSYISYSSYNNNLFSKIREEQRSLKTIIGVEITKFYRGYVQHVESVYSYGHSTNTKLDSEIVECGKQLEACSSKNEANETLISADWITKYLFSAIEESITQAAAAPNAATRKQILQTLSCKSMRKFYQSRCDEINRLYLSIVSNQELPSEAKPIEWITSAKIGAITVRAPLKAVYRFTTLNLITAWASELFGTIQYCTQILQTWPSCPIDLITKNIELIASTTAGKNTYRGDTELFGSLKCREWLRTKMPPTAFFNILSGIQNTTEEVDRPYFEFYKIKNIIPLKGYREPGTPITQLNTSIWNDIIGLLNSILATVKPEDLEVPPRWRANTFHDYIMKKSWEIKGPGESLPKVLLPAAITLKSQSGVIWSFSQPKCTNELAWWGRTVRNCVGSSGYIERVKRKTQFIILCFLDGKPAITVSLKLEGYSLIVQEIRQPCNQSLDAKTNGEFKTLFEEVLELLTKDAEAKRASEAKSPTKAEKAGV